jgi:8-oxo-dGTP diphosphatase
MKKIYPKIGVGVIIKNKNRILLLKRINAHGANTWCPPGGHLEWNESPEDCAKREVKEETGCQIKNTRFLAITNDKFKKDKKHYITINMEADYKWGKIKVRERDKATDIQWFPYTKLPDNLFLPLYNLVKNNSYPKNAWKNLWLKK